MPSFEFAMMNACYDEHLRKFDKPNDAASLIDWMAFRPIIASSYHNLAESGGRPNIDCIVYFWSEPKPLRQIAVSSRGPCVNAAVIKRLGEPPFWREPEDFTELMECIYQNATSKTLRIAFS